MTKAISVGIAGLGAALPELAIPNAYFEQFVDTSDEWIQQRTGIASRRWLREGEEPAELYTAAAQRALDDAGVAPAEVDLIILGTISPDYILPSSACLIQERLGATKAAAFDLTAACTGFLYALMVGQQFVATGTYRNVLVIGAEALSRIVDMNDRGSCILFGDGAGAVLLQPHAECGQGLILKSKIGSDGGGYDYIWRPRGGALEPMSREILAEGTHLLRVRGREVYRFAVDKMTSLIEWALEGYPREELGLVVPHQVNARILETARKNLGLPDEKLFINIERYGNTSAASVPLALEEARSLGLVESGKLVAMCAFGAGLTWGGALVRW